MPADTEIAARRWLITGCLGQLGHDLNLILSRAGAEVLATDRPDLDILDSAAISRTVAEFRPDVVLNAAAYTAVDAAENDEDNAYRINATGPAIIAAALAAHGGRLIHVSTDYVFPGDATRPYEVADATGPATAYGRTKLAGEVAVRELLPENSFVVRTAWVYGANGANFVKTMARLEKTHDTVKVIDDQRGSPTWTVDLATGLIELALSDAAPGIYHCTGAGETTWFDFTRAIFAELGADPQRVLPTTSAEYGSATPRPSYSVLSDRAWVEAGLTPMPQWRDALATAFAQHRDAFRPAE
ncbi:dTDP-4-dehydrorhamnose reductase [Frankineae bacterium MT45]|nr:dTDP-4-dehydrorhamnose reductase [Frankineae bacterium MT45]